MLVRGGGSLPEGLWICTGQYGCEVPWMVYTHHCTAAQPFLGSGGPQVTLLCNSATAVLVMPPTCVGWVITTRDSAAECSAKHHVQCPHVSWAMPQTWWEWWPSTLMKPGVGQEAEVSVKWTEFPKEPAATISGCPCWIPEPLHPHKDIQRLEVDQWEIQKYRKAWLWAAPCR